jgi:hypothetical protein
MVAIRDMTWMRHLVDGQAERFELRGFRIALVTVQPTAAHHGDRFRYRLLAFDPALGKPVLSVDLESDILGDYCLSVEFEGARSVIARYDDPPTKGDFRALAIAQAESRLPASS